MRSFHNICSKPQVQYFTLKVMEMWINLRNNLAYEKFS